MKHLIKLREEYSETYSVKFKHLRSKVLLLCNKYETKDILINNCQVEVVDEIEHLGIVLSAKKHGIYSYSEISKDMKVKSNALVSNFVKLFTCGKIEVFFLTVIIYMVVRCSI